MILKEKKAVNSTPLELTVHYTMTEYNLRVTIQIHNLTAFLINATSEVNYFSLNLALFWDCYYLGSYYICEIFTGYFRSKFGGQDNVP